MAAEFAQCAIQTGYWLLGFHNAQFHLGVIVGSGTTLRNVLGQQSLSLKNTQTNLVG